MQTKLVYQKLIFSYKVRVQNIFPNVMFVLHVRADALLYIHRDVFFFRFGVPYDAWIFLVP